MPIEIALILFALIIYVDLRWHIIPDFITLPSILWGMTFVSWYGAMAGALVMLLSGSLGILIWKNPGIGGGDLKLLAMIGGFFGPFIALMTYAAYPLFVAIYAFTFERSKIPCAPFIIGTCLICLKMKGYYGS